MNDTLKSWLFVVIQAILLALLIFFTNSSTPPSHIIGLIGRAIEVLGLVILLISFYDLRKSLTALPMPIKSGVLQVRGLYKYVRHPMYVGVLTLSLGLAVSGGNIQKYLLVIALYVLFSFKARYEERLLIAKYPNYKQYMHDTPRFIPGL